MFKRMAKPIIEKINIKERKMIKMKIEKNNYDNIYPYTIKDAWGGTIHCTKEDLINLEKEIKEILDKLEKIW